MTPKPRLILPPEQGPACYHVVSRCVDRAFKLGTEDKEQFVKAMPGQEAFSGVRVLTFCVLDNHFHLLLEVPPRPVVRPGADDSFGRLGADLLPLDVGTVPLALRLSCEREPDDRGGGGAATDLGAHS